MKGIKERQDVRFKIILPREKKKDSKIIINGRSPAMKEHSRHGSLPLCEQIICTKKKTISVSL